MTIILKNGSVIEHVKAINFIGEGFFMVDRLPQRVIRLEDVKETKHESKN